MLQIQIYTVACVGQIKKGCHHLCLNDITTGSKNKKEETDQEGNDWCFSHFVRFYFFVLSFSVV